MKLKQPQRSQKTTWMPIVRQELTSIRIKLGLSKEGQTLTVLSEVTVCELFVRHVVQYQLHVTS